MFFYSNIPLLEGQKKNKNLPWSCYNGNTARVCRRGKLIQETQLDYWYELISDFYEKGNFQD